MDAQGWSQILIPQAFNLLQVLITAKVAADAVRKAEAELAAAGATEAAIAQFKAWATSDIMVHVASAIDAVADFPEPKKG